jgi:uncharacterized protein YaaW (UPF0174 family)
VLRGTLAAKEVGKASSSSKELVVKLVKPVKQQVVEREQVLRRTLAAKEVGKASSTALVVKLVKQLAAQR